MSYQRLSRKRVNQRAPVQALVARARELCGDYVEHPDTLAAVVQAVRGSPLTQHPDMCIFDRVAKMHKELIVASACFRTAQDLERSARYRQKEMVAALPADLRSIPRWKLVQDRVIPSMREIKDQLIADSQGGDRA